MLSVGQVRQFVPMSTRLRDRPLFRDQLVIQLVQSQLGVGTQMLLRVPIAGRRCDTKP